MAIRYIQTPKPLPHQAEILLDPTRFKIVRAGRRFGKSSLALVACLRGHGPTPGHWKGALDGGNIYWISKVASASNKRWDDLKRATKHSGAKISEQYREITLPGGGMINVRSADKPDSLRGDGPDGVVLDEGAFMSPDIWYKVFRPALSDKQGWAIFPTTPNGFNWFRDICTAAQTRHNWKEWHFPTSKNPVIAASEIAEAKLDLSTRDFDQEYEAEFVEQEGAEWPASFLSDKIWFRGDPPSDMVCKVIAVDPSKGKSDKSDYSAIIKVGLDTRGKFWVEADIERLDTSSLVDRCVTFCKEYKPEAIGFESIAFMELLEDIFVPRATAANVIVSYHKIVHGSVSKVVRIRRLTEYLSRGLIQVRDTPGGRLLVDQMRQFPQGQYDDGPDGLEMALRLLMEQVE